MANYTALFYLITSRIFTIIISLFEEVLYLDILKNRRPLCKLHIVTVTQEAGIGTVYLLLDHPLHISRYLFPYLIQIILIKMVLDRTVLLKFNQNSNSCFCYTSGFHKPSDFTPGFAYTEANI